MGKTLLTFLDAVTEMCEAWDSLRGVFDGSDEEMKRMSLDDGSVEVAMRTKRMVEARASVARAARAAGAAMGD
jgi:hypothetical protein